MYDQISGNSRNLTEKAESVTDTHTHTHTHTQTDPPTDAALLISPAIFDCGLTNTKLSHTGSFTKNQHSEQNKIFSTNKHLKINM